MLDTIRLYTSESPDKLLLNEYKSRSTTKWVLTVERYKARYTITENKITFKLYIHKTSAIPKMFNGICHAIELNAHNFPTYNHLEEFLKRLFPNSHAGLFFVSRLDFCVDIPIHFDRVLKAVHRERIRSFQIISHDKSQPSSIVLGKEPIQAKIYNKSLERSLKIKKLSKRGLELLPLGITRFEVKMLRKKNKNFPIRTLAEVYDLLSYGPFNLFKFKKITDVVSKSRITNEQKVILQDVLHENQFSSMQETIMYARTKFNIRKQQYPQYFNEITIADLNLIHHQELSKWLNDQESFQEVSNG